MTSGSIAAHPPSPPDLRLAHCSACGSHTYPANVYACRHCGGTALTGVALPQLPRLLNAVTLHAQVAPGLPDPCVIGEVQLAPGVVEEAWIDVADDALLTPGMALHPQAQRVEAQWCWRFTPVKDGGPA